LYFNVVGNVLAGKLLKGKVFKKGTM